MPKIPPAINGGTTYPGKKGKVPRVGTGPGAVPPPFTYNPTVAEEGTRAYTEEQNRLHEIRKQQHYNQTDLATGLKNITTAIGHEREDFDKTFGRGKEDLERKQRQGSEDLAREQRRGQERIGNEAADTELTAHRRLADYQTKRNEITRQFGELGHRQAEAMNATGTLDQGTSAAAAAARARNQQLAEAPITTEEGRTKEDLVTRLSRLFTAGQQLDAETRRQTGELGEETARGLGRITEDHDTSIGRLNEERDRHREELHRGIGREESDLGDKKQEVLQAGSEAKQNTLTNEIWEFKENHPAAFAKWAAAHPNAAAQFQGSGGPRNEDLAKVLTTAINHNGGTTTGRKNKKKKGR